MANLVYVKSKDVVKLQSEEGVLHGDLLGPTVFSAALHPIIAVVQDRNHDNIVLAYLDNVYRSEVFEDLKNSLKDVGLKIREDKCKMFFPEVPEDLDVNIPISKVGISGVFRI